MSSELDLASKPKTEETKAIQDATRKFYESNNVVDGFAEMLAASEILGEDADYRAKDLMRVNLELVERAIDRANALVLLLDDKISRLEGRS